ncbi:MAG: cytochrome P450 [Bacteroidota bacterium]
MEINQFPDAFGAMREQKGVNKMEDQNDPVLMVLRHRDVRKSAHNYKTFQSAAQPGRIVVPSEVNIRSIRQIPFEVDPPTHGSYRALLEAWFKRPNEETYQIALKEQLVKAFAMAKDLESIEVVKELALPIQSRALTLLLNMPIEEAEEWISWGTHVFRSEATALDDGKANSLDDYLDRAIEQASKDPGDDLFSVLLQTDFQDRKLNKEEIKGVLNLTFAGGRDTVINAITNTIAYFSKRPEGLQQLRDAPHLMGRAVEELVRYFTPLTHMGRVATEDTQVCEHAVKADTRISLCWASANRDPQVFENPNEVQLDRKVNPHVGFGFSHHKCLGATHARQLLKTLLEILVEQIDTIEVLDHEDKMETWGEVKRKVGFEKLVVKFT